MTVTPSPRNCRTTSNSRSLSRCESAEFGSSSTRTRAFWRIARAISTSCISATESRPTFVSGSSVAHAEAGKRLARLAAHSVARHEGDRELAAMSDIMMFSATLSVGQSDSSW